MCGIAGAWFNKPNEQADRQLSDALRAMRFRGPDDQGYEAYPVENGAVYFGHTRLSIIDLSAGGHQPMHSHDGRFAIVFNGEIYNYRELRRELADSGFTFRSDSDTEVLLAAWAHWGQGSLKRLVGMFAFVIFDKTEKSLTCVRDPFGIKPFFYTFQADGFAFASEIKALTPLKRSKPELDWQQAYNYLVHADYDSSERTFLRDVRHLPPGHELTISLSSNKHSLKRWWTPDIAPRIDLPFADAAVELRNMFLDSIRFHLRSDVPLGAALSGGLDSSAVVCAIRHVEPDATINTFSYIASDSRVSEEHWADEINSHVGAQAHKVRVTAGDLANDLDDMIAAQGEPFGSTSIYAQYRVFRLARESGVTVTLDGQGADELLGGYLGYPGSRMHSLVDQARYGDLLSFMKQWSAWPGRTWRGGAARLANELATGKAHSALLWLSGHRNTPAWINAGLLREAGVTLNRPTIPMPTNSSLHGRRMMATLREALTKKGLPALLRHADRNSMRFSVESRVPFLTTGMAEFLLSLPEEYLVSNNGETKSIFRAAMRGIVPDNVLDRKDKIGFATPEYEWLVEMADTIRGWLRSDIAVPFLDKKRILQEFELIIHGNKPFSWQVWRWINFFRWHTQFINQ